MRFESATSTAEQPRSNFDRELRDFLRGYPQMRRALQDLRQEYSRQEWSAGSLEFVNEIIPGGFEFLLEGLEEQRVSEFKDRFRELSASGEHLNPDKLNDLVEEISQKNQEYLTSFEKLLQKYTRNFVDNGLDNPKHFTHPEGRELIERAPVAMLNRAGFFQKLEEKIFNETGKYNGRPVTVLNADITKLRNSDMVKDALDPENPSTYADILLQDTAKAFAELTHDLENYLQLPEGVEVQVGRYGGDEFVFSVVGDGTGIIAYELQTLIKDRIGLIEAYYLNETTGEVERRPAAIKNDTVERFEVPQDPTRADIFLHYLQQGLVFDEPQIEAVRDRFRNVKGEEDTGALLNFLHAEQDAQSIYPEGVESVYQKIQYLFRKNPLDGAMAFKAYLYDRKHGTETTAQVLEVIERVLYDSLLRARVQDFSRFQRDLEDKKYSTVWGFDMKFIKEINDNISYADADLAIRGLYETIVAGMSPEDQEAFVFSRRGGTFFVGLKTEAGQVNTSVFEHLNNLRQVQVLDSVQNPMGTTLPVGTAVIQPNLLPDERGTGLRRDLDGLFDTMDERMYNELLENVLSLDLEQLTTSQQENPRDYDVLTYKFFTGKRKQERLDKLVGLVLQNRTRFKEADEKKTVLDRLERMRGLSSLPQPAGQDDTSAESATTTNLIGGRGFDFRSLESSRGLSFAEYPFEHQVAAVLSFAAGPRTLEDLSQIFTGTIPRERLVETLNKFDYLHQREPSGVSTFALAPGVRSRIRTLLQLDEPAVAQMIFDRLHPQRDLSDPTVFQIDRTTSQNPAPKPVLEDLDDFDFRNIQ